MNVRNLPVGYTVYTEIWEVMDKLDQIGAKETSYMYPVVFTLEDNNAVIQQMWGVPRSELMQAWVGKKLIYDWDDNTELDLIYSQWS